MNECKKFSDLATCLPSHTVISIEGVDSEKFLQGQLTCDVVKLAENSSTLTAHCDPKGKVNAIFRLIKLTSTHFFIIIENNLLPNALDQLKKYAVFSKVTFQQSSLKVYACSIAKLTEILPHFNPQQLDSSVQQIAETFVVHVDQANAYFLIITPQLDLPEQEENWYLMSLHSGVPHFTQASQLQFIPQALNLQCLENAISFSKGCYIGQETVARAKYRGANKLAMFTLVADGKHSTDLGIEIELKLDTAWRKTGTVLSVLHHQQRTYLQVILNKETTSDSTFRLNEQTTLTMLPLAYELV